MKNRIILALALCLITSYAYTQEGSVYIGGMAGYSSSKNTYDNRDEVTSKEWNFSPELGTWLTDDLQIGVNVNLSGSDNGYNLISSTLSPGLYLRRWYVLSDLFSIFGGFNIIYISTKEENTDLGFQTKVEEKGIGTFLDFGAALSLGEKFSIVGRYAALGYQYTKVKDTDEKTSSFGFDVDMTGNPFNVGLYYTIR